MKRRGLLGLAAAAAAFVVAPFRSARAADSNLRVYTTPGVGHLSMWLKFDATSWDAFTKANEVLECNSPWGDFHTINVSFCPMSRESLPENDVRRRVEMYRKGDTHSWRATLPFAYNVFLGRVREANPEHRSLTGEWVAVLHVTSVVAPEQAKTLYDGLSFED